MVAEPSGGPTGGEGEAFVGTASASARPALFERYPAIAGRLPRIALVAGPTPVQRLTALERRLARGPLWAKRDDLSASPFGGNKPRKLEFLLGAALARGARTLVTFGGLGSNHALATAVYGRRLGLAVTAILVPQPVDEHTLRNLRALSAQGARLLLVGNSRGAVIAAARACLEALVRDRRLPYLIPPGGSSPVGTLGYVEAGLELAEQVRRGELPAPAAVFVAAGSCGTAAGLLAGFRLAGLSSRVVAVRVSDALRVDAPAIARLASATLALLRRSGAPVPDAFQLAPADLDVWDGYLGAGYGHPTREGDGAMRLLDGVEGLTLDRTYTGKAAAAFLDAAAHPEWREKPLLLWHTGNSLPLDGLRVGGR